MCGIRIDSLKYINTVEGKALEGKIAVDGYNKPIILYNTIKLNNIDSIKEIDLQNLGKITTKEYDTEKEENNLGLVSILSCNERREVNKEMLKSIIVLEDMIKYNIWVGVQIEVKL